MEWEVYPAGMRWARTERGRHAKAHHLPRLGLRMCATLVLNLCLRVELADSDIAAGDWRCVVSHSLTAWVPKLEVPNMLRGTYKY